MEQKRSPLKTIIIVIVILWISSHIIAAFMPVSGNNFFGEGNVALIKIDGIIVTEDPDSYFSSKATSSSDAVDLIKLAGDNPSIDAILFEINSPGGSAVASLEIASAVKKVNKTTVAYIREVGASGGYWVASATDFVVANPLSITGSIGVISSYLEFSGLMEKYGVGYERLVAGKYKDVGTPYRNLSEEERGLLLGKLDLIHDFFIEKVAENRNMEKSEVEEIATGMFYLGSEAKELGLIDKVGGMEDAKDYIKDKLEIEEISLVEYKRQGSFLDILTGTLNRNFFFLGQGMTSAEEKPLIMT